MKLFVVASTRTEKIVAMLFILSLFGVVCGSLMPEIGGDSLAYHLNVPKEYLLRKTTDPLFFDINSYYPIFMNLLYLIGLATGGVATAKFFNLFVGLMLFGVVKIVVEYETKDKELALFVALSVWLTPLIYNMLSTTYTDVSLSLFTMLSLIFLINGFREEGWGSVGLSGFFLGCAFAIKYLALMSLFSLAGLWIYLLMTGKVRLRSVSRKFFIWSIGVLIACGYVYIRNWILEGNPFFPYFGSIFGTAILQVPSSKAFGMDTSPLAFVSIFWNTLINPTAFGQFSDRIGAVYLIFYIFSFFAVTFVKRSRKYAVYVVIFYILWFYNRQVSRYFLPILPVIAIVGSIGYSWAATKLGNWFRKTVLSFGCFAFFIYCVGGLYHYRFSYLTVLGKWSESEYLNKMERSFPIATWINENLPEDSLILIESEPRQYYINRKIIRDQALDFRTHYQKMDWSKSSLPIFLHSMEITHLLLSDQIPVTLKAGRESLLRNLVPTGALQLIASVSSQNIRDPQFQYRLYALSDNSL